MGYSMIETYHGGITFELK